MMRKLQFSKVFFFEPSQPCEKAPLYLDTGMAEKLRLSLKIYTHQNRAPLYILKQVLH